MAYTDHFSILEKIINTVKKNKEAVIGWVVGLEVHADKMCKISDIWE
jgi:hypothetical protein